MALGEHHSLNERLHTVWQRRGQLSGFELLAPDGKARVESALKPARFNTVATGMLTSTVPERSVLSQALTDLLLHEAQRESTANARQSRVVHTVDSKPQMLDCQLLNNLTHEHSS